jgi:N utilization substance protein B
MSGSPQTSDGQGSPSRVLSSARLAAVQAIYQLDMAGGSAEAVVAEFLRHRGGAEFDDDGNAIETDEALFAELVRGVTSEREALDAMVGSLLVEGWPLARIERVMAAILRAGAYELKWRPTVPARVVINEYVDVAHAFFGGREVGMVNGVLDRLARVLRQTEMEQVGDGPERAAR